MEYVRGSERGLRESNEKSIQRDVSRWHTRKKFPKRENESENFQNGDELNQKFFRSQKKKILTTIC